MAPSTRSSSYAAGLIERMREVQANLSYSEIARRTDLNRETARRYMTSGRPSVEFVARLGDAFGISGTWLLTGRGPKYDSTAGMDGSHTRAVGPPKRRSSRRRRAELVA